MKKLLLSIIAILMLILTLFGQTALAELSPFETWEGYGVPVKSGSGTYGTWETNGTATQTSASHPFSGSVTLRYDVDFKERVW